MNLCLIFGYDISNCVVYKYLQKILCVNYNKITLMINESLPELNFVDEFADKKR